MPASAAADPCSQGSAVTDLVNPPVWRAAPVHTPDNTELAFVHAALAFIGSGIATEKYTSLALPLES